MHRKKNKRSHTDFSRSLEIKGIPYHFHAKVLFLRILPPTAPVHFFHATHQNFVPFHLKNNLPREGAGLLSFKAIKKIWRHSDYEGDHRRRRVMMVGCKRWAGISLHSFQVHLRTSQGCWPAQNLCTPHNRGWNLCSLWVIKYFAILILSAMETKEPST